MTKLSVLSVVQQEQIWQQTLAGKSSRTLAAVFGVSQKTISDYVRNRRAELAAQADASPESIALQALAKDTSMPVDVRLAAAMKWKALQAQQTGKAHEQEKPKWWDDPNPWSADPAEIARWRELNPPKLPSMVPVHRAPISSVPPSPVPTKPTMTREESIVRLVARLAQAEARGDVDSVNAILAVFQKFGVPVPGQPNARPQLRVRGPFEQAKAAQEAQWELERWTRDIALKLEEAQLIGTPEEAEAIKVQMRSRGVRPIGDPDELWPKPEVRHPEIIDDSRGRSLQYGRRRPEGAIVELTRAGWVEWHGD